MGEMAARRVPQYRRRARPWGGVAGGDQVPLQLTSHARPAPTSGASRAVKPHSFLSVRHLSSAAAKRGIELIPNDVGGPAQWVGVEVRIAVGGLRLRVAEPVGHQVRVRWKV